MTRTSDGAIGAVRHGVGLVDDDDLHLFAEGNHYRIERKLGSHPGSVAGEAGTHFAVWAPSAARVSVIGDFNGWDAASHPLQQRGGSGIWEGFVPGVGRGTVYKYRIVSTHAGHEADKADPFAVTSETPPRTGSVVWDLDYEWGDAQWMASRKGRLGLEAPASIYEIHLGSWMRVPGEGNRSLGYRELAPRLIEHLHRTGFTHVEFLPVMEHPFFGSWGYQVTGYFAPTSRFGSPQDFMFLVDQLHQAGIGVILDWVPSHFPEDAHGLGYFDGTHLFEHADPRQGFHPDWKSAIFNYGRHEVRSFLISSALYWLEQFHADGLRVDGVASMLYLDYSRQEGEWVPNRYGGRENLEAIAFLRQFNEDVYEAHPDVQTVAEESTSWPMVSRPNYVGGLGFGYKWDMGWMHDTLDYMSKDPIHRKYHHNRITFRMVYAFHENFVLPLSHDEVVHGKGSLIGKMPGDEWQRFANLRLLLGYMWGQSGKKMLFMGGELGQWREWNHDSSLDWHLLEQPLHGGVQRWVGDLNRLYREEPALHYDCHPDGFSWVDCNDSEQSLLTMLRWSRGRRRAVLVACNFTPIPRTNYRVGVPWEGRWVERLNGDAEIYGGSGWGNQGGVEAAPVAAHGHPFSVNLALPPLAAMFFVADERREVRPAPRSARLEAGAERPAPGGEGEEREDDAAA
jgi:1,4-alpha-glucan branching enzyme